MTNPLRWIPAGVVCLASLILFPAGVRADDLLNDVKERMAIEAQRVEKEFTDNRLAAYKLVRNDNPQLLEATQKLQGLLALLRADTSLSANRRAVLLVTIKADLDRVKDIAAERRRATVPARSAEITRTIRDDIVRSDDVRRVEPARRLNDEVRSVYDKRREAIADSRSYRAAKADRLGAVRRDVDRGTILPEGDYNLPKNWLELSKRRTKDQQKMTAKEREIIKVLDSIINVDYSKNTFEEVIEHLRKATKVDIVVDKRALEEAGASYESTVTVKMKSSVRTVLKRILADLNLAYVIKDEVIQITSRERASQMTTTKSYYLGDIATVVNTNMSPFISQAIAIQNINNLITTITQTVEPQSWKVNNPEAAGVIAFNPATMSITVKQTAEIHFKLGSR